MTSPADFVHLHVHSDYSLIDGAAKTEALAKAAKKNGQVAVALTDHGSVSGTIDFWKACNKEDVKPLIGCEAYLAPGLDDLAHTRRGIDKDGNRIEDEKGKKKSFDYDHFTLIAKNLQGWHNLQKLSSIASLEGFYYRPRMSWALLTKYHEGLIALSGCLSGQLSNSLKVGKPERAMEHARRWKELFGDDYYVELQPVIEGGGELHQRLAEDQAKANDGCLAIARALDIKTVATADVHYVDPDESAIQEVKICVNSYKTLDENRKSGLNMPPVFYFKSSAEMQSLFRHYPQAALATREIADKCEKIKVLPGKYFLPKFITPDGSSSVDYFRRLCWEGLVRRYGAAGSFDVAQRLQYEMDCIEKMGFVDYFLVTQDFTTWARKHGVPVGPGRGSAAGSTVSYCLGITNIDPLRYGLLFERFLNPERVSMPDIDIDFCERGRSRVIEYVRQKYGEKCVAQIITFGESKAKSAIRDVGRVLDMPIPEVNKIAKLIPEDPKAELKDCLETIPELKVMAETSAEKKRLFELALGLEGLYRSEGKHAAGVVIGDTDLMERIPLKKVGKGDEAGICTAFSMEQVEEVGLLKMDFLGLRTITQIYDTLALIKATSGRDIDPDTIPVRDNHSMETTRAFHRCPIHEVGFGQCRCCDKTLEVFRHAETNGVFQVESGGMRKLLKQMRPDRFDDIVAIMALFRPGPLGSGMDQTYVKRKNGEEAVTYDHQSLEPVLKETYGQFIYQEQLMRLSVALAGFTLPQADELRKATAKKKPEAMAKIKDKFIPGCVKHSGLTLEHATAIWDKIVFFSEYSFNKCLAGSTEVVDAKTGEVSTVEKLFKSKRKMLVHSLGDDLKLRPRRVTDVVSNGRKKVYELLTRQGKKIVATGTHRFRIADGWRRLDEIEPGDLLATPRRLSVRGDVVWPEYEIVVLAGLLTEGNLCHPNTLYFTAKDSRAYVDDFMAAAAKFERTEVQLSVDEDGTFRVRMNTARKAEHGYIPGLAGVRCGAFKWADRLGLLGHKATTKSVPSDVFRFHDDQLALFIGRLWSGDGFVSGDGNRTPFYATSSPTLARHVQLLLLRIGVVSGIHPKTFMYRGKQRPGYTVHVVGSESITSFVTKIAPHIVGREHQVEDLRSYLSDKAEDRTSKDTVPARWARELVAAAKERSGLTWDSVESGSGLSMKEFCGNGSKAKRGFRRSTMSGLADFFGSDELRDISESDVFWDEVVSITPAGIEETYDLTVDTDHNFVANGIVVHNSHSAAYGLISWQTAWLKANYPVEFFAALLTSWAGSTDKLALYVEELRRFGIPLEPPDINESDSNFKVRVGSTGEKVIVYGLDALKGVGSEAIRSIVESRARVGRFTSIFHFCESVDLKTVTSAVLDALAKSGAFRSTGATRAQILESVTRLERKGRGALKEVTENVVEAATRLAKLEKKDRASGQQTLFKPNASDSADKLPEVEEWTLHQALDAEREALGLYLTGHPLEEYADELAQYATVMSARVSETHDVEGVIMGGVVRAVRKHISSRGEEMAFITLEDMSGKIDAVAFPAVWERDKELLKTGRVLFLKGDLDTKREIPSLKIGFACPMDEARTRLVDPATVLINFWHNVTTEADRAKVEEVLASHPGTQRVFHRWWFREGDYFTPQKQFSHRVKISRSFKEDLRAALSNRASYQIVRQ